jgi:hypothetical protein
MFTNLASLLLGVASSSAEPEGAAATVENEGEARLSVHETDDDWLLVDAEDEVQRGALMSSMAVAPLTPLAARSRSHSVSSLPCLEESWYAYSYK